MTLAALLWSGTWLSQTAGLSGLRKWDLIGISTLGDVWGGNHIKTFQELQEGFALHNSQFYKYLGLRHAIYSYQQELEDIPEFCPWKPS